MCAIPVQNHCTPQPKDPTVVSTVFIAETVGVGVGVVSSGSPHESQI